VPTQVPRADPPQIRRLLAQCLSPNRFPVFCAAIVGGSTLLHRAFHGMLSRSSRLAARMGANRLRVLARFLASLAAAAFSFALLNAGDESKQSREPKKPPPPRDPKIPVGLPPLPAGIESYPSRPPGAPPLAGRTLDLTLFAAVRALDTLARLTPLETAPFAAPAIFAVASGVIMHAWFYAPLRLPRTYAAWISRAARVDPRLVHALRLARPDARDAGGGFAYGRDTGAAPLLASLAAERGLPAACGDPAVTAPVPCRLVHAGRPAAGEEGKPPAESCEAHAALRWADAWTLAWTRVYAPLAAIRLAVAAGFLLARRRRARGGDGAPLPAALARLVRVCAVDSARSAAFLATFVAAFHYGVCLARTRLGPPLLGPRSAVARRLGWAGLGPQAWDGGLGVLAGCALCGWSVLLEPARRRAELALFVAPRALGVALPRRYEPEHRWIEHGAFSLAAATLLTVAAERPDRVRGWFGAVLKLVLVE
jgi:hypothetical protein